MGESTSSVNDRVSKHRAKLRSEGLRPVQIWVTDVRTADFAAQAYEQSRAVATSSNAHDDQAFIDALSLGEG